MNPVTTLSFAAWFTACLAFTLAVTLLFMQFEDADIEEFVALWKEEFGETISPEEARHRAFQVMELYVLLATATPKAQSNPEDSAPEPP
jgi:hypothetical protein